MSAKTQCTLLSTSPFLDITTEVAAPDGRKPILVFSIDLGRFYSCSYPPKGGGKTENVHMFKGDTPLTMATDFTNRHALDKKLIPILSSHIQKSVEDL